MSSTSSTVCHQSSLEPLVRLKLAPPSPNFSSTSGWDCNNPQGKISHIGKTITTPNNLNLINKKEKKDVDIGGWSFLQSLGNPTTQTTKTEIETERVYVHPLAKRSASVLLSPRSLEMCTENLGCETGSEHGSDDMSLLLQSDVDIASLSLESSGKINPACTATSESSKITSGDHHNQAAPKRMRRSSGTTATTSFPPPLTSINGSNGVQVRPHREGGRLVLKAVSVVSPPTACFQAERGDGRLRLRLLKDLSPNCDIEEVGEGDDGGEELDEDDRVVEVGVEEEDGVQNETEAAENEVYNCEEEKGFVIEAEEMDGNSENVAETEEMDGNSGNAVGEKGNMGNLPRPSRCNEGGRGNEKMVINWPESFWVAT